MRNIRFFVQYRPIPFGDSDFRDHTSWRDFTTGAGWTSEEGARSKMPADGDNGQEYRVVERTYTDRVL